MLRVDEPAAEMALANLHTLNTWYDADAAGTARPRVCPDNGDRARARGADAYEIDLDLCKGCGLCAQECPCGALEMIDEQI